MHSYFFVSGTKPRVFSFVDLVLVQVILRCCYFLFFEVLGIPEINKDLNHFFHFFYTLEYFLTNFLLI